jgi:hypothetical protein
MPRCASDSAFARDVRAARAAELRAQREGRRAKSVAYDAAARRVVVGLTNGIQVSFPLAVFSAVVNASGEALHRVTLSPSGSGLEWDELDAHYSIPELLAWAAGRNAAAAALGSAGGKVRSEAKAAAARANRARGGRPRRDKRLR